MPEPAGTPSTGAAGRRLEIVADLRIEVGDDRGSTRASLVSGADGLVLDVDEPSVLLRAVPGRGLTRDLPLRVPRDLIGATEVRLRSRGHDLGLVRVSEGGKLAFRPTPAGLVVAGRTALSYGPGRAAAWTAAAVATALVLRRLVRRAG